MHMLPTPRQLFLPLIAILISLVLTVLLSLLLGGPAALATSDSTVNHSPQPTQKALNVVFSIEISTEKTG